MKLDATSLPNLASLLRRLQSMAMLDAIICPDWQYRYYSFNAQWSPGQMMGSMRNGEGDNWFILFADFGAAIKGLSSAAETDLSHELKKQLPKAFDSFLNEPAFTMDKVSYCYWYEAQAEGPSWQKVFDMSSLEDGSYEALSIVTEPADAYIAFANEYYETSLTPKDIQAIYNHLPLTEELIQSINPDITLADLTDDISEIAYPGPALIE